MSESDGRYTLSVPNGTYAIRVVPHASLGGFCLPVQTVTVSDSVLEIRDIDFADSLLVDYSIDLTIGRARPGRQFGVFLTSRNLGKSRRSNSAILELDNPSAYVPQQADTAIIDSVVGRWVYFKPLTLAPGGIAVQPFYLLLPPTGSIVGSTLGFRAHRLGQSDGVSANDSTTAQVVVTSSQDPNDKTVDKLALDVHAPAGARELRYTIRFQNTGTDTAFSIVVRDTLSELLDIGTLCKIAASHPLDLRLLPGRILEARFTNVLLPDSTTNERASHGSLSFSIQAVPGITPGIDIYNQAAITFDYNAPVLTDTAVTNNFIFFAVKPALAEPNLWVPNPTSGNVSLKVNKAPTTKLYAVDAAGRQTPLYYSYSQGEVSSTVNGLAPGIYHLRFADGTGAGRVAVAR